MFNKIKLNKVYTDLVHTSAKFTEQVYFENKKKDNY